MEGEEDTQLGIIANRRTGKAQGTAPPHGGVQAMFQNMEMSLQFAHVKSQKLKF